MKSKYILMKTWLNKILIPLATVLALAGCEKDEERAVLSLRAVPTLAGSTAAVVLTEDEAAEEAVSFHWTPADFGYNAAVSYILEFDKAGNDFAAPRTVSVGEDLERSFTVAQLNEIAIQLGLTPEVEEEVEVRVRAAVSDNVDPAYSTAHPLSITPYSDFIEPVFIYAPGAYQGWDPATADSLVSVEDNGIYVGYITFTDPDGLEFKFTPEKAWELAYGDGGEGTLNSDGGASNLSVPEPYTYQLEVNLNDLTWDAEKYSWAIIGDATPNGWSDAPGDDTDMRFYMDEGVWKVNAALTQGELKFRLNDDWGVNYGDDDTSDNLLNAGGGNIPVEEAGNYTITLDLSDEENPTYSLEIED